MSGNKPRLHYEKIMNGLVSNLQQMAARAQRHEWGPGNRDYDIVIRSQLSVIPFGDLSTSPLGNGAPLIFSS